MLIVQTPHAEQLSRSIMRLMRPSHLREEGWTDLYCNVLSHPDGGLAIALPESETIPVHIEADGSEMASLLAVFVSDGAITPQEAAGIESAVQSAAGQRVRVADFIPPSWSQYVLTQSEAEQAGWIPLPDPQP